MDDINKNQSSSIPSEPPLPPPDPPTGTFVIPDIEPNTDPVSHQQSSQQKDFSSPILEQGSISQNTSSSQPTVPLQQTVVIDDPVVSSTENVQGSFSSGVNPSNQDNQPPSSYIPQGLIQEVSPQANIGDSEASIPPENMPNVQQSSPPLKRPNIKKIVIFLLIIFLLIGFAILGVQFGLRFVEQNQKVTIQYWGLWENQEIIAPVIAEFEANNPNISVRYIKQNHRQYRERLQAAINRGDGPDVFRFHATWVPMLKNEIEPIPPDVMSPSEFTSKFYKVASNDLLGGSTLWGIPIMIEGLGLFINDDLFATAGVAPPQTYEEFIQIVPKLTVRDGNTIVTSATALGTTNNVEHFSDILALMIMQNGGKLSNPVGKEAEEALLFYKKFSTPSDPLYTWNSFLDNSISAFANGRVAMIFAPSWRVFDIKALNPSLRFRVEPVPQLPGNPVTWASYWVEGVSSQSKYKKQAMKFLKYLTSKDAVVRLYTEASKQRLFGEPYALVELSNSLENDLFVGAYIKQAPNARSFPLASLTHDNGINDRMIQYMIDAVNSLDKGVSPKQALETMSKGFQQVFSSYGLINRGTAQ
ncbi:MAG: extracellular solute-binding protein [Patescibacteria group bacterium]|nr:extracellular solute-binding protein [Patescibacteria group bacterium]